MTNLNIMVFFVSNVLSFFLEGCRQKHDAYIMYLLGALRRRKNPSLWKWVGGSRFHSEFLCGKSTQNSSKTVVIFWSIYIYKLLFQTRLTRIHAQWSIDNNTW